jgi:hypothetical protein
MVLHKKLVLMNSDINTFMEITGRSNKEAEMFLKMAEGNLEVFFLL